MELIRSLYRKTIPDKARLFLHRRWKTNAVFTIFLPHDQKMVAKAQALYGTWDLPAALACIDAALEDSPNSQKALQMRVQLLTSMGRMDAARRAALELIERYPVDKRGRRQLAALGLNPPPASMSIATQFIVSQKQDSYSFVQSARYLYEAELFDEAIQICDRGLVLHKRAHDILKIKADSLHALYRFEEAIELYTQIAKKYRQRQTGGVGVARCLFEMGNAVAAETAWLEAYRDAPAEMKWSVLLLDILQSQDKLLESYRLYRKKPFSIAVADYFGMKDPSTINLSSGAFRTKSAFLVSEGGPGDELRLSSIYPELSEFFGRLCISSDPRLVEMMRRTYPEIDFLPVGRYRLDIARQMDDRGNINNARLVQCISDEAAKIGRASDFVAPVLDTLADLRATKESFLQNKRRALVPEPSLKAKWIVETRASGRPQIGLAWRSMLQTVDRNRHYFSVEDLAPLGELEEVDFWILQPRLRDEELGYLQSRLSVRVPDTLDLVDDIEGQLALTSCLDCVISPFTTTGELSAAAGTATVLVSGMRNTLWRRNVDGTDIFSSSAHVVAGDPIHDKLAAMHAATNLVRKLLASKANR